MRETAGRSAQRHTAVMVLLVPVGVILLVLLVAFVMDRRARKTRHEVRDSFELTTVIREMQRDAKLGNTTYGAVGGRSTRSTNDKRGTGRA